MCFGSSSRSGKRGNPSPGCRQSRDVATRAAFVGLHLPRICRTPRISVLYSALGLRKDLVAIPMVLGLPALLTPLVVILRAGSGCAKCTAGQSGRDHGALQQRSGWLVVCVVTRRDAVARVATAASLAALSCALAGQRKCAQPWKVLVSSACIFAAFSACSRLGGLPSVQPRDDRRSGAGESRRFSSNRGLQEMCHPDRDANRISQGVTCKGHLPNGSGPLPSRGILRRNSKRAPP